MKTLTYRGPEGSYSCVWGGASWLFDVGVPVEVPDDLGDLMAGMNPRGCSLETAREYGAQIFDVEGEIEEGGED